VRTFTCCIRDRQRWRTTDDQGKEKREYKDLDEKSLNQSRLTEGDIINWDHSWTITGMGHQKRTEDKE